MHQFPLIREYKREVPSSTQSVEIDRSKVIYEKAVETQTDELNEKYNKETNTKISDSQ